MNSPRADSVNSYSTNSRTYESTKDRYEEVEDEEEEAEEEEEEEITPAELIEKLQQVKPRRGFSSRLMSFN
jgi:hypothetical protein